MNIPFPGTSTVPASFGSLFAVGDIDGDSKQDLAVQALSENDNAGSVTVYYGDTIPFTRSQRFVGSAWAFYGSAMALGDVNGDGHADLFAFNSDHVDAFLAPSAGGTLPSTPTFQLVGDYNIYTLAVVADLNRDGLNDVVVGNPVANSLIYVVYGRTTWPATIDLPTQADVIITAGNATSALGGYFKGLASIPDINGDGFNELFVSDTGLNRAYIFMGSILASKARGATLADASQVLTGAAGSRFGFCIGALDSNFDSKADIFVGAPGISTLLTFPQLGNQTFGAQATFATASDSFGSAFAYGDLDRDGLADLVVGLQSIVTGTVRAFYSAPSGISSTPGSVLSGLGSFGNDVAIGDFNGDGNPDLVVSERGVGNGSIYLSY
ncbi:MAG: FG-GAP-like repeat-containing protein [Myxococcales bacterium]